MKNTFIWVIVALVLVAGVFWFMNRSGPEVVVPDVQEQEEEEESPQAMVVAMSAQNDSGISGIATLTALNGNTLVELNLSGAPEGIAQPAHIHTGSCAEIGGVVYPLEFPVNGVSETTLSVSLDALLSQLPLALNVHQSPEAADVYVACGDLI